MLYAANARPAARSFLLAENIAAAQWACEQLLWAALVADFLLAKSIAAQQQLADNIGDFGGTPEVVICQSLPIAFFAPA